MANPPQKKTEKTEEEIPVDENAEAPVTDESESRVDAPLASPHTLPPGSLNPPKNAVQAD